MDLMSIGSANQYAKNMARRTVWDLKKRSGDFTSHATSLRDYVNITKASSVLPQTDETDKKMSSIMTKAQAGKKLSLDEWEYLKAKNPMLYEKLREIEREQENYEKELRRCKTQDEARRLHMSKLGEIMSAAKNGDESALYRLNRMTRTMIEFTKSDEYHKMPTEAEEAIERESERQARQEALRAEAELREAEKEAASEEEQEAESVSEPNADEQAETVSKTEPDAETESGFKRESELVAKTGKADANIKPDAAQTPEGKFKADAAKTVKFSSYTTQSRRGVSPTTARTTAHPESVPAKRDAAPVLSVGERAYLSQRSAERPRRRAVDAKA